MSKRAKKRKAKKTCCRSRPRCNRCPVLLAKERSRQQKRKG